MNQITLIFESGVDYEKFINEIISPEIKKGQVITTDTSGVYVVKEQKK
jgi:hypothetical protein